MDLLEQTYEMLQPVLEDKLKSVTATLTNKSIDVDNNFRIDYTEFLAATISEKTYLQKDRLFEAFCMLDKDNNGHITKEELMDVLRTEKNQEKEIENYIKQADKNGDGIIDYIEFLQLMGYEKGSL